MKKNYIFILFACLCLAACATKMHIGDFDLDTRTLPKDSIAFAFVPAFVARREKYCNRIGLPTIPDVHSPGAITIHNVKFMIPLEKDPLLELCVDEEVSGFVHSDIWLQANLSRLESSPLGVQQLLVERFRNKSDKIAGYDSSVSEDLILECLQSRRIQTASELRAFSEQLDVVLSGVTDEIKSKLTKPQAAPEPAPAPEPGAE